MKTTAAAGGQQQQRGGESFSSSSSAAVGKYDREIGEAVKAMAKFCSRGGIALLNLDSNNSEGVCGSLLQCIVCNMDYVDRKALLREHRSWEGVGEEDAFVDWDLLENTQNTFTMKKQGNVLGNSTTWVFLLKFLSATNTNAKNYPKIFSVWCESIRTHTPMAVPDVPTVALRCMLASNIVGNHRLHSVEAVLSNTLNRDMRCQAEKVWLQVSETRCGGFPC